MSDDYSNQDPKRNKRRGGGPGGGPDRDYKQPRKPQNKDYQGSYDSRGYDKPSKDQYGSNKGSYYNQYDDYDSRPPKNDNYSYKPKGTHRRQGTEHGAWKKKAAKIPKENVLEAFAKVKSHPELNFWLREYKDLFVKEKQAMVNDEVFQLDPNNGLMPKAPRQGPGNGPNESDSVPESTQSTNTTTTTSSTAAKGFEMFDFGKDRYDPIAAMRDRNRKDQDTSKPKKGEVLEETLEDEGNMRSLQGGKGQQGLEEDPEEELGGHQGDGEEGFEGEYSNIDEMFAKKLKNNEIPETYEDAFDDLVTTENKQEKLKQMEDEERPEWEDIDTKEVIEDIKKEDFIAKLSSMNQEKKGILGERAPKFEQGNDFAQSRFLEANKNSGEKQSSNKAFDIDFSKYNFDVDLKLGADDFPIKQEDLFGSAGFGKNPAQQPQGMNYPGMNVGGLNPASMMQQGNMMRPTPQQLQGMQYQQQMQHMNQMPQMHQQMHQMHPMHHPQMDYANMQMRGMGPGPGPMGPDDMNRHQFGGMHPGQQNYMVNQLPPYKRDPAREAMNANVPRPQPVPNVIFKFFSPSYDEKSWHYIDMQKRVQGPFSGRTMDEWFLNGHLPLTLNVTIGKNNGYKTIKELADIISNPTSAMQANMRGGPPPQEPPMQQMGGNPQSQQAYSGISDLLSNRPDLMQYSPAPNQPVSSGKTKTLDEVEKPGPGGYPPQYAQYMKSGGGQNYPEYHEMQGQGQGQYPGGKPYPKGNGPQGYGMDPSQFDNNPQHKMALGAHPGMNSDPQGRPGDIQSGLMMGKSLSANPADQGRENPAKQAQGGSPGLPAGGAQAADMTAQLKNMLGLGALGGLGGLGGLNIGGGIGGLNIGGPSIGEANQSETPKKAEHNTPPKEQDVEKQQERAQAQPQVQMQAQPERVQQQYQEKQPQRQEKQNYNQYYQEKQQQAQGQKKPVKAPKIDTSDFPSLTESYK